MVELTVGEKQCWEEKDNIWELCYTSNCHLTEASQLPEVGIIITCILQVRTQRLRM